MKPFQTSKRPSAFTLVELLIVIAIIAVLAAAIFVAVDPARRLHESRNAVRSSDVTTILEAVKKYQVDNDGAHYSTVDALTAGQYSVVGTDTSGCNSNCTAQTTQTSCVDLSGIGSNYLSEVPSDPSSGSDGFTDYYLSIDSNGAITVGACDPEQEGAGGATDTVTIEVTR